MKKHIYKIFSLLLIVVFTSCSKDYFDINDNPNSPTEGSITPQLILPNVLHATAERMGTSYDYSAHWMGYWTRSGSFGPSNPLENYALTTDYEQEEWINLSNSKSWYNILADVDLMEKKAEESGQTFYLAAAKLLKSIGFMYLVDQYNNVPYSQAFNLGEYITPGYDKGQDIYNDLLAQLDQAATLLETASASANPGIETSDILFHGDALMWRKLINTQRLKLLIRQSQVFGGTAPTAELAKIANDGSGFLMSEETASVQPGYTVDNLKQNPFWDTYKRAYNGDLSDNFNRANNYLLNKYRSNNDIRYTYVFSEAVTPLNGNTYWGYDFGLVDTDPNIPKAVNSSDVAGPGLAKSATQPQWLFTSVESMFLQAEAIQRGWIAGDPQTAYNAAVTESFKWLGVTDAETTAAAYLGQASPIVSWNLATDKISLIVTQKYLALPGINNFEAWVDYRRLGVPADVPISLSPSRSGRVIPKRLLYPANEYSYNAANVAAEGTINPQTSTIFWDK
jgi:hypothetical protein